MRIALLLTSSVVLLGTMAAVAEDPVAEDPNVVRAQAGIEKLRALVDAGAVPRAQLEQAEDALADTQDMAVLRRLMYTTDLSEEQAADMVEAAQRRLERREKKLDKARTLLDSGLLARGELAPMIEDEGYARKEYDLAVTRLDLLHEQAAMPAAPHTAPSASIAPRFEQHTGGQFTSADFEHVETAYQQRFGKPLPVSAMGETAVHRALGFDHRGRVDVALNPDQPEGVWLRQYLADRHIPYIAFRQAVPGKATGAHIHMGPMSTRLAPSVTAD